MTPETAQPSVWCMARLQIQMAHPFPAGRTPVTMVDNAALMAASHTVSAQVITLDQTAQSLAVRNVWRRCAFICMLESIYNCMYVKQARELHMVRKRNE